MYDDSDKDKIRTLGWMVETALERSHQNKIAARDLMREYLEIDRRFDSYDKDRLVRRIEECRSNGAKLDLTDPRLRPGGQPRPLEKTYWQY
jgi:hypothetical protein